MVSFLELPYEIRALVYKISLAKNSGAVIAGHHTGTIVIDYGVRRLEPELGVQYLDLIPPNSNIDSLALLRTCKQISLEAAEALYGNHRFSAVHFVPFRTKFAPTIGVVNTAHIKVLHLGCQVAYQSNQSSGWFPQFLTFIAEELTGLQDLTLSENSYIYGDYPWARFRIMWTAAWITLRHPQLKRAIWSETRMPQSQRCKPQWEPVTTTVRITAPSSKLGNHNDGKAPKTSAPTTNGLGQEQPRIQVCR